MQIDVNGETVIMFASGRGLSPMTFCSAGRSADRAESGRHFGKSTVLNNRGALPTSLEELSTEISSSRVGFPIALRAVDALCAEQDRQLRFAKTSVDNLGDVDSSQRRSVQSGDTRTAAFHLNQTWRGYMRRIKAIGLGTAASFMTFATAQAADLPVKAKPVEYVKVCSLYGAGFWYIPGTDTCIQLSGYLRVDTTFNGGLHGNPYWTGNGGQGNRYADYFQSRSRFGLNVDLRTATEYGVVRTFAQQYFQLQSPDGTSPFSGFPSPTGSQIGVNYLFIQFAGFTFGHSSSVYDTPWNAYPNNLTTYLYGGPDSCCGVNNIQYTAEFGGGFSASIGLEDPLHNNRTNVFNTGSAGIGVLGVSPSAYANAHAPDIAARFRVDQAWGLFQISAMAHEVSGSYNTLTAGTAAPTALSEISGHPDSKWGGSGTVGLQIKNLPTGPGDDIKLDATYAVGITKNVISGGFASSPNLAMFGGTNVPGAYQSIGLGATSDAVYLPTAFAAASDGQLKLTKAWGFRGAYGHNWDPYWSTALFGAYSSVRYDGAVGDLNSAKGAYCSAFAASHPGQGVTYTCDPNWNLAQIGLVTRWTPVKGLTFAAEVMYSRLDQKMSGTSAFSPGAPKPAATYAFKDQDTVELELRVQRNF
ncbi:porin [Bradyrhizobium sp. BWA-3-5]|uniref:porin n=1 Tax=Bradyrhizobium sp. BWA-3-5 TaxID=3080013 RepID=UPI00293EF56E|nr:porin [Bradyrhizobium sp. BWA-3-5]WOH63748.1 porin [Bradyrhizobium sp. BWA-3-5]